MKALLAGISSWGALSFAQPARAASANDTVRVAMHWSDEARAGNCLGPELVRQRVETQLGHAVFVREEAASDVTLNVDVTMADSTLRVELELERRGESLGNRSLQGPSSECAKLFDSLVVVIALLVDVPPPKEELAAPAPSSPSATAPPAAVRRVLPAPRGRTQVALNARAVAIAGLLPGAAAGFGFNVRAAPAFAPSLAWRLGGDYLPRDRVTAQGGRVTSSALSWQVGFSPLRFTTRYGFRIVPWLLILADAIAARGQGFAGNRSGYRWLPTGALSASAEWPLSGALWLTVEPALGVALARPRFLYEDSMAGQRELFRPSLLQVLANLGLTWRFF